MKVTIRFEGGAELAKALESLPHRVSRRFLREALVHAAEPMRAMAGRLAPHEPGAPDLRDAMIVRPSMGQDSQEAAVAVGPQKKRFYGSFQEFGTKNHPAQPFLRPAFDAKAQEALQRLGADIWASLASRGVSRSVVAEGPVSGEEL